MGNRVGYNLFIEMAGFFVIYICGLSDFRQKRMPGNEIMN